VKDVEPDNLVFLDETGVLLGLTRSHARSLQGTRVYALKPFYRGSKVTAIGAISLKKVVALMTIDDSIDLLHEWQEGVTVDNSCTFNWARF
jgi:hypothetical protein